MAQIKKAVITAAGLGTRFLPVTKGVAKEMFPIIDKPTLEYLVEEAVASGIEEVIIPILKEKTEICRFFERNEDYEDYLIKKGHPELAEAIRYATTLCKVTIVELNDLKGLGYTIYSLKDYLGDDPFVVILGDDLIINKDSDPVCKQLIDAYNTVGCPILGVQTVDKSLTSKYGIIKPGKVDGRLIEVKGMVEKPKDNPPSCYAALGRYVLTKDIFECIEKTEPGAGDEIQLTDALTKLDKLYAYDFIGNRYDIGDKYQYVKAIIDISLDREDIGEQVKEHIKELDLK